MVDVAYSRRPGRPRCSHAAVTQRCTAMWSGWNVIPSGPNVRIVSGRTSSMSSTDQRRASTSWSVERAVGKAEEAVVVDAEHGHRRRRLPAAQPPQAVGWPGLGVGRAVLAGGHRHAHDTLAVVTGGGHHAAGEVRLVVGMCPDGQDRAQLGDRLVGVVVGCVCIGLPTSSSAVVDARCLADARRRQHRRCGAHAVARHGWREVRVHGRQRAGHR